MQFRQIGVLPVAVSCSLLLTLFLYIDFELDHEWIGSWPRLWLCLAFSGFCFGEWRQAKNDGRNERYYVKQFKHATVDL